MRAIESVSTVSEQIFLSAPSLLEAKRRRRNERRKKCFMLFTCNRVDHLFQLVQLRRSVSKIPDLYFLSFAFLHHRFEPGVSWRNILYIFRRFAEQHSIAF